MKKVYMKPTMQVVKIQQQHIICSSPGDQTSIPVYDDDVIIDEGAVW